MFYQNQSGHFICNCVRMLRFIFLDVSATNTLFWLGTMGHGITNPPWPNAAAVCSFHAHRTLNTSPSFPLLFPGWTDHLPANSLDPLFPLPPVGRFAKRNHRQGEWGGSCCCPWGWWWPSWIDAEPTRKVRRMRCRRYQISVGQGWNLWLLGMKKKAFIIKFVLQYQ